LCVTAYEEAANLLHHIGDQAAEAVVAFNVGHAYKDIPALRDLDQAEHWYRRSLDMTEEHKKHDRAQCLMQLGAVDYGRFKETKVTQRSEADLLCHLNAALKFYYEALNLLPSNALNDLAVTHNQLGILLTNVGDLDRALPHYSEAIRYDEIQDNRYGAAGTRYNVALSLAQAGRFQDALLYAQAALRNFETYGEGAAGDIQDAQQLIAQIEEKMRGG
jgi:tetratricopeptide (TPR) repeat protein